MSEFLREIQQSIFAFMKLCKYEGKPVRVYRQTKKVLETIVNNKRSIVILPRGAGKSFCLSLVALWYFFTKPNSRVAIFSRSHRQSKSILETCCDIIDESPMLRGSRSKFYIDQKMRIRSHIGSEITAFPYDARTILGQHPDIILADECAYYQDDSFMKKVVIPMLSGVRTETYDPKIVLASTYDRKSGFFYEISQNPEKYNYAKLVMNWRECDGYNAKEMEEKKREIGTEAFISQYECEPMDTSASFFPLPLIERCISEYKYGEGVTIGGIDLAKKRHYASISVIEVDNEMRLVFHEQYKLNYSELAKRSKEIADIYKVASFLVDTTTGEEFVDFGMEMGIPLKTFAFTKQSKMQILDHLRIRMEQNMLKIDPKYSDLISDLRRYDIDSHLPDSVASLALAVWNERERKQKCIIEKIHAIAQS